MHKLPFSSVAKPLGDPSHLEWFSKFLVLAKSTMDVAPEEEFRCSSDESFLPPKKKAKLHMMVQPVARRSTRSTVRNGGFKLVPMLSSPEPKKKPRSSKFKANNAKKMIPPPTPIKDL